MRLVCGFEAPLAAPIGAEPTRIAFTDDSYPNRLGWREIVVRASGVTLRFIQGEQRTESVSARLTAYPPELVALPLADHAVEVDATIGGAGAPAVRHPRCAAAGRGRAAGNARPESGGGIAVGLARYLSITDRLGLADCVPRRLAVAVGRRGAWRRQW